MKTEPSIRDQVIANLYSALRASSREESYISPRELAEIIKDALGKGEHTILAKLLEHDSA